MALTAVPLDTGITKDLIMIVIRSLVLLIDWILKVQKRLCSQSIQDHSSTSRHGQYVLHALPLIPLFSLMLELNWSPDDS